MLKKGRRCGSREANIIRSPFPGVRGGKCFSLLALTTLLLLLSIPGLCDDSTEPGFVEVDVYGDFSEGAVPLDSSGKARTFTPKNYVLNLFPLLSSQANSDSLSRVVQDGFHAALQSESVARILRLSSPPVTVIQPSNISDDLSTVVENAMKTYPSLIGVVGPLGDDNLEKYIAYTSENNITLTALGPCTRYSSSVGWDLNKYFIRASPKAEIYALVTHLVTSLHPKRVGLLEVTGAPYMTDRNREIKDALYTVHNIMPISLEQSVNDVELDMEAFNVFLQQRPQVVIVASNEGTIPSAFVEQFSINPQAIGIPVYLSRSFFYLMENIKARGLRRNFYFTSTNALPSNTDYKYIQSFEADMRAFMASNGTEYFKSYEELETSIAGGAAVYGWLVGQTLAESIGLSLVIENAEDFQNSLFDQRHYNLGGDYQIGPFGGECDDPSPLNRRCCICNQGGHVVNIYHELHTTPAPILDTVFSFPRDDCLLNRYVLPFYSQPAVLLHSADMLIQDCALEIASAVNLHNIIIEDNTPQHVLLNVNEMEILTSDGIAVYQQDNLVDIIFGPIPNLRQGVSELTDVIIVDPIAPHPVPRLDNAMVVYLMPTLDQQIYIAAEVAKQNGYTCMVVLRRSPEYEAIRTIIQNAGIRYSSDIKVKTVEEEGRLLDPEENLQNNYLLIIGLLSSDIPLVKSYLEEYPSVYIASLYQEFSLRYKLIISTFDDGSVEVQKRFLTCTNLPTWSDFQKESASANPVLKAYHKVYMSKSSTSPLTLQGWYSAGVVDLMMGTRGKNMAKDLQGSVYMFNSYVYGEVVFGKLVNNEKKIQNYAASNIKVISVAHILDSKSVPISFGPLTPDMTPPKRGTGLNVNVLLAVAIPFGVVVCVVAGLLLFVCLRSTRNGPPTNPSQAVTLLVCDIYQSAGLWASHPREMLKATESYQSIVRKLIREMRCYEVKLIGDAFLIVSDNPVNIVNLSVAVQRTLLQFDWQTDVLDAFYVAHELKGRDDARESAEGREENREVHCVDTEKKTVANSVLPDVVRERMEHPLYSEKWNGLRVRMGIHTGLCEIRMTNKETKEVGYHGVTVATVTRLEVCAHGGQILMSQSTWEYLQDGDVLSSLYADIAVNDAGWRTLRGIEMPIQIFEIEAISGREWKMPTTNNNTEFMTIVSENPHGCGVQEGQHSVVLEDEDDDVQLLMTSEPSTGAGGLRSPEAAMVCRVMAGLLQPYTTRQKLAHLKPLMEQWHISTQVQPTDGVIFDDEAIFDVLARRLANRLARVFRVDDNENHQENGHCSYRASVLDDPVLALSMRESNDGTAQEAAGNPLRHLSLMSDAAFSGFGTGTATASYGLLKVQDSFFGPSNSHGVTGFSNCAVSFNASDSSNHHFPSTNTFYERCKKSHGSPRPTGSPSLLWNLMASSGSPIWSPPIFYNDAFTAACDAANSTAEGAGVEEEVRGAGFKPQIFVVHPPSVMPPLQPANAVDTLFGCGARGTVTTSSAGFSVRNPSFFSLLSHGAEDLQDQRQISSQTEKVENTSSRRSTGSSPSKTRLHLPLFPGGASLLTGSEDPRATIEVVSAARPTRKPRHGVQSSGDGDRYSRLVRNASSGTQCVTMVDSAVFQDYGSILQSGSLSGMAAFESVVPDMEASVRHHLSTTRGSNDGDPTKGVLPQHTAAPPRTAPPGTANSLNIANEEDILETPREVKTIASTALGSNGPTYRPSSVTPVSAVMTCSGVPLEAAGLLSHNAGGAVETSAPPMHDSSNGVPSSHNHTPPSHSASTAQSETLRCPPAPPPLCLMQKITSSSNSGRNPGGVHHSSPVSAVVSSGYAASSDYCSFTSPGVVGSPTKNSSGAILFSDRVVDGPQHIHRYPSLDHHHRYPSLNHHHHHHQACEAALLSSSFTSPSDDASPTVSQPEPQHRQSTPPRQQKQQQQQQRRKTPTRTNSPATGAAYQQDSSPYSQRNQKTLHGAFPPRHLVSLSCASSCVPSDYRAAGANYNDDSESRSSRMAEGEGFMDDDDDALLLGDQSAVLSIHFAGITQDGFEYVSDGEGAGSSAMSYDRYPPPPHVPVAAQPPSGYQATTSIHGHHRSAQMEKHSSHSHAFLRSRASGRVVQASSSSSFSNSSARQTKISSGPVAPSRTSPSTTTATSVPSDGLPPSKHAV